MTTLWRFAFVAALSVLFAGCATVLSGTTQAVNVRAIDADSQVAIANANCTLSDSKGNVYPVDPHTGSVTVGRGYGALTARCSADGYAQQAVGAGSTFNGVSVVNVIWLPGFVIDAVTGAMQKYPDHITVTMAHDKQQTTA